MTDSVQEQMHRSLLKAKAQLAEEKALRHSETEAMRKRIIRQRSALHALEVSREEYRQWWMVKCGLRPEEESPDVQLAEEKAARESLEGTIYGQLRLHVNPTDCTGCGCIAASPEELLAVMGSTQRHYKQRAERAEARIKPILALLVAHCIGERSDGTAYCWECNHAFMLASGSGHTHDCALAALLGEEG